MSNARRFSVETAAGWVEVSADGSGDTEYAYRNGQCIALSLAIHERTGWPIVAQLSRAGDQLWEERMRDRHIDLAAAEDGWFYAFVHSLVHTPDDFLLDIYGEHDPEAYLDDAWDRYGTSVLVSVDADALIAARAEALKNGAKDFFQDPVAAGAVAEAVLADYRRRWP